MNQHVGRAGIAALLFLALLGAVSPYRGRAQAAPHDAAPAADAQPHSGLTPSTPHDVAPAADTPLAASSAKPSAPDSPAHRPDPGSHAADCHSHDGTRLLLDFFALAAETDDRDHQQETLRPRLAGGTTELQFLLATVPEPRLGFDGAVEAMTRAMEAAGYTLDRYALPWDPAGAAKATPLCYEQRPGVALFVHTPDPKLPKETRRLLLLYIIGETPIAGIHKPAFLGAVQETSSLRALLPADRCLACDEVRLVGPAFSGSVTSLEILLEQLPALSFNILSGRATNAQLRPLLTRHTTQARRVRFQATVIPDEALQTEFYRYLSETLGADPHDIALVTESSTVYGQAVIAANTPQPPETEHAPDVHGSSPPETKSYLHAPRLTLPMPLHISRLHSALAKRSSGTKREAGESLLPNLTATLPQLLDDSLRADVFPTLSERTTASEERALANVLSTISAEKIHYVGILATDVQDKLFLAYQIRTYSPDVVLFTFESDILYSHPDARLYLKGMLVISPYPLFTRNQQWTYPYQGWQERLQFASEADQGVYNATVALLGCPDQLLEYSPASAGIKEPQSRPAIWISTVGNETLFPLAFIKDYADNGYVYQNPVVVGRKYLFSPSQQGTLSVLLLILGIVGALLCVGYFRCYYAPPGELPPPWSWLKVLRMSRAKVLRPDRAPAFGHDEARRQPLFLLFVFAPMWVGYLLIGAMHFVQLREGNLDPALAGGKLPLWLRFLPDAKHLGAYADLSWNVLAIGMLAAACQLAFSVTVFDILANWLFPAPYARLQGRLRARITEGGKWKTRLIYPALALTFFIGTGVWFGLFLSAVNQLQNDFNTLLLLSRSAHPALGLSPAMPMWLLAASIQLLGYCNLQRIALLDKLATVYVDLIEEVAEDDGLRTEVSRIAEQLQSPGRLGIVSALGFALLVSVTVLSDLKSLEHYSVNFLFRFLFALVLSCTGYSFYRFVRLWYGVRQFLRILAHHPLAPALERLPAHFARSLSMLLLGDLPDLTRREAEEQHFHLLMNHLSQLKAHELAALSGSGPEAEELLRKIVELRDLRPVLEGRIEAGSDEPSGLSPPQGSECTESGDNAADWRMVFAARKVVQILKCFWAIRPLPGVLVGRGEEKPSISLANVPAGRNSTELYLQVLPDSLHLWLRLAEDFIALQVAAYITRLFPHLRNTMLYVTLSILMVVGAMVTYPFQPQHYLLLLVWMILIVTGPLTVISLVQMNRDEVLSRLAKSEPGKVTWDRHFISQLVIYGVLPLLSLAATQFPEVRGMAFSWLESLLKILK